MNKRQATYATLISIMGVIVFYFSFQTAAPFLLEGGLSMLLRLLIMTLLLALLRSVPEDFGVRRMHVGFGAALVIALIYDATVAIVAYESGTVLACIRDQMTKKRRSILNGSLRELLLGDAVIVSSVMLGATFYRTPADIGKAFLWPESLRPALVFFAIAGATGWVLFSIMALLGGRHAWRQVFIDFLLVVPGVLVSLLCAVLAILLMRIPGGELVALWATLALIMTRFALTRLEKERGEYYRIIRTLSEAIEAKESFTQGHARRVERCVIMIGRSMRLSRKRIAGLRVASLLHDVGKIGVDDTVLRKDGGLDEREWEFIRKHPQIGHKIIDQVELSPRVRDAILHHHERYDGNGYPLGIKLADFSIEDSILAAADAFVAMISERPYRPAMSIPGALDVLRGESGKQFHPDVVRAFEKNERRLQAIHTASDA